MNLLLSCINPRNCELSVPAKVVRGGLAALVSAVAFLVLFEAKDVVSLFGPIGLSIPHSAALIGVASALALVGALVFVAVVCAKTPKERQKTKALFSADAFPKSKAPGVVYPEQSGHHWAYKNESGVEIHSFAREEYTINAELFNLFTPGQYCMAAGSLSQSFSQEDLASHPDYSAWRQGLKQSPVLILLNTKADTPPPSLEGFSGWIPMKTATGYKANLVPDGVCQQDSQKTNRYAVDKYCQLLEPKEDSTTKLKKISYEGREIVVLLDDPVSVERELVLSLQEGPYTLVPRSALQSVLNKTLKYADYLKWKNNKKHPLILIEVDKSKPLPKGWETQFTRLVLWERDFSDGRYEIRAESKEA